MLLRGLSLLHSCSSLRFNRFNHIFAITLALALTPLANAQTWTQLHNLPPVGISTALLLTDGTVMAQESSCSNGNWWRLTPDNTGSYVNGTWTRMASLPGSYVPLYFGSAVLPDGRLVISGGEYNSCSFAFSTIGAIYDPAVNSWTSLTGPPGESRVGDASGIVLPNGTFMLAPCCSFPSYLLNPSNLTWTQTGSNKADNNDEEGWTLLPNGKVLTIDTKNGTNSELYDPSTGSWSSAGSTGVQLTDASSEEIGPAVLRPDGTVFAAGGTPNTAIYNSVTGVWTTGPTFPKNSNGVSFDVADGPAALLPNGNVLIDASPGVFQCCVQFFEFDGANLNPVPVPASAANETSFQGRMLVLPTGQILFTDGGSLPQIYTSSGTFQSAWQPTITSVAATLNVGSINNVISGTQFNGLSQGAAYGDDAQSATNYPLVRITNTATGHVFYAKTHDHSTMGVATGSTTVSTQFDVPGNMEAGSGTLEVVANGIPSSRTAVNLQTLAARAHTFYLGTNQDTYHLSPNKLDAWQNQDLTTTTGNSLAAPGSALTAITKANHTMHTFYIGGNQHVFQLYWNTAQWINQDLTAMTGTSTVAASGSALTSLTLPDSTDYVFYFGSNQHVNLLLWNGSVWSNQDLTIASGAVNIPPAGSSLTSVLKANGTIHVFYEGADQHIYQVYWDTVQWRNQDLSAIAVNNSTLAAPGSALTSATRSDNTDYVTYLATDQHVNLLLWDGSAWTNKDLTTVSSALNTAAAGSSLTSVAKANGTVHIFYLGTDHHVYQVYWSTTQWFNQDLTTAAGTSVAAGSGSALASATSLDSTDYVVYLGGDQHLNLLLWDGSAWSNRDLTAISGAANTAAAASSLATILGDATF